ncbi:MAG: DNA helicase UvrD, partial [Gammaproteobacteria bacterium]
YHHYPDNQWRALNALCRLLPTLAAALSLHFQQHKACDFTEITLAALRALGGDDEPSELALKLDYQIRHILTDEFQDTSSAQFAILKRLTAGWLPDDGRSLFIVGDAMQSLYGFRNANVGLFLEARSQPIGQIRLQPLDLQVNFRSQAGLIDWVNRHFPMVFPARENIGRGAVPYSPASAFHEGLTGTAVTLDAFVGFPDRRAEAQRVVELVAEAKFRNPEGSIAILVRNRTHLPEILDALRQAGHRWQAADIDPLASRMPVVDLMSLTRALLSPADRIAWLSILRTPWCGLDNCDLLTLCLAPTESDPDAPSGTGFPLLLQQLTSAVVMAALSPDGKTILQRVAPILIESWRQRQRLPLRCWIEGTWQALGGPETLRSSTELEQCQQYLDLLESRESAGGLEDWPSFEKAVQSLYAAPDQGADPNLQVMTIHKSKGLEFDTVIIPGLNRKPRGDDSQLLLWQERVSEQGEEQLLIGPASEVGEDNDALYRYLDRERKLKTRLETARVLYVGVTRAIRQLHLLCTVGDQSAPVKNSLLDSLWPALQEDFSQRAEHIRWHEYQPDETKATRTRQSLSTLLRLPVDWLPAKNRFQSNPQTEQGTDRSTTVAQWAVETTSCARHTGTVMHRILRQIVMEGMEHWSETTIPERLPFWDIQLRQLGIVDTREPLAQLQRAVANCLSDATARWILDRSHSQSACEYALAYSDLSGESRTAIVDRTFVCDGTRWIIDYKTSSPASGESVEQFLAHQRKQYREQLDHYARLFEKLEDRPVKCALYFPLIHTMDTL